MSPHKFVLATLNWYEKKGEKLVGEENITGISEEEILQIFDAPFWNGIYQCWSLGADLAPRIQPHVEHRLQPGKYVYFLELQAQEI